MAISATLNKKVYLWQCHSTVGEMVWSQTIKSHTHITEIFKSTSDTSQLPIMMPTLQIKNKCSIMPSPVALFYLLYCKVHKLFVQTLSTWWCTTWALLLKSLLMPNRSDLKKHICCAGWIRPLISTLFKTAWKVVSRTTVGFLSLRS